MSGDTTLGGNSTQPTQYTQNPATLPMQVAVLVERIAGLQTIITEREISSRRALELQAVQYEHNRQLLADNLAHLRDLIDGKIAAEKFVDYVQAQEVRVHDGAAAITEKFTDAVRVNTEAIAGLLKRIERLES